MPTSDSNAFLLGIIYRINVNEYSFLAGITVLYFDHILTLSEEIQYVWKQRLSLVNFLFILNRYTLFFGYIVYLFFLINSPFNNTPCHDFKWVPGILSCLTQSIIAALLVIRCYALYHDSYWILAGMSTLGLATVAAAAWAMTQVMTLSLPPGLTPGASCFFSGLTSSQSFKLSWSLSFAFDSFVFLLTVWKTYDMWKLNRAIKSGPGLSSLLMRDGVIYFIGLAVASTINFITFLDEDTTFEQQSTGNNSVITHIISSVMIGRMILNLRIWNAPQSDRTLLSNIVFNVTN